MIFSIVRDMFRSQPKHRAFYLHGRGNRIIVNMDGFVKMYKRDPNSVKGATLVPPAIGSEDFGHFEIPINANYELVDEQ